MSTLPVTSPSPYTIDQTVTTPTTTTGSAAASATVSSSAAYPCVSSYMIQSADTCQSISESQQVASFYLMQANDLAVYCSELPEAGSSLCIPQSCNLYTVTANDTCYGIVESYFWHFSQSQLISWNPNINDQCSNLNMIEGYQICVSFPGTEQALSTTGTATITATAT